MKCSTLATPYGVIMPLSRSRCPHTTNIYIPTLLYIYVSSAAPRSCSMCVLILLYLYPHTICVSRLSPAPIYECLILLHVSSLYYMCHLAPLSRSILVSSYYYMCPHTTVYVSCSASLLRVSSNYSICVIILLNMLYYYMCLRTTILLYMSSYYTMCPHTSTCPQTTIFVSPSAALLLHVCHHTTICVLILVSYCYICVVILLDMCFHCTLCVT